MRNFCLALGLMLVFCIPVSAKENANYTVSAIPDSLKLNANIVVRDYSIQYIYKSNTVGIAKYRCIKTVLNKNGDENASFTEYGDKFRKIVSFKAVLYDALGMEFKTYKKSDLTMSAWSEHLATDNFHYYLSCESPSYPYTVMYDYEVSVNNGIIRFPVFFPQDEFQLSVQKASFVLRIPAELEILEHKNGNQIKATESFEKSTRILTWEVSGLKAVKNEIFLPHFQKIFPVLYTAPKTFVYDGIPGEISTIEKMGIWQNLLNAGRNELSDAMKQKVDDLIKNVVSDKEKIKVLYDYVGNSTRYESIQLGVGGFQPIPAAEVFRTGFGDCKGLTFLLKSLLAYAGINSNYVIVRLDDHLKQLNNDFSNYFQTNHVILQVPLPQDTLWLECTNTRNPFGFNHNGITGHDAIVVLPQGAKMMKIPDYPDSLHVEKNELYVKFNADGQAQVTASKLFKIRLYDKKSWLIYAKPLERKDYLQKDIQLPNTTIQGNVELSEAHSALPELKLSYSWSTSMYGTKTGNRFFLPVNVMQSSTGFKITADRTNDVEIANGWVNIDEITIELPEGIQIESLPQPVIFENSFGKLNSVILPVGNKIVIRQTLNLNSGTWSAKEYTDFYTLSEKTRNAYSSKIILKKI